MWPLSPSENHLIVPSPALCRLLFFIDIFPGGQCCCGGEEEKKKEEEEKEEEEEEKAEEAEEAERQASGPSTFECH